MEDATSQLLPILQALLPGFVTMIIFHWLSTVPKPGQFEQVIQALICAAAVKACLFGAKVSALWAGQWLVLGSWVEDEWHDAARMTLCAAMLGFAIAYFANNNTLNDIANLLGVGKRGKVSIPEWDVFVLSFRNDPELRIVLNLLDGRRLRGYPRLWPANPTGHFLIELPSWAGDEKTLSGAGVEFIMIANVDVLWVEILEKPEVTR
ncbi:DUF6338 family protein [Pseudomonas sp. NPDC087358]|uniref:DUF6338 family protein n=1 Tax=Pseudomonas sp. NPDC087358 TaxID=3364439 RepID=UPI00384E4120